MDPYQEHQGFTYATDSDWDRAEAAELGAANPEAAYVCTNRDVWHPNPYYQGPPQPHPEDEYDYGDYEQVDNRSHRGMTFPEKSYAEDEEEYGYGDYEQADGEDG